MHLIWKRPDGFHGASPTDFSVLELGGHSRLWLHKSDRDQYPFRIAGGWEEKDGSVLLNNLVNLLPYGEDEWLNYLDHALDNSLKEDPSAYLDELQTWLAELKQHVKGDTWETEILREALTLTSDRLQAVRGRFLESSRRLS